MLELCWLQYRFLAGMTARRKWPTVTRQLLACRAGNRRVVFCCLIFAVGKLYVLQRYKYCMLAVPSRRPGIEILSAIVGGGMAHKHSIRARLT